MSKKNEKNLKKLEPKIEIKKEVKKISEDNVIYDPNTVLVKEEK